MPARGSPGASRRASGWVASQSSSACTSRPSKSLESTVTVPPDSPKPRESHVSTLKPAARSAADPTAPKPSRPPESSPRSRTSPQPWVIRIVGARAPGGRPSAGRKLAASGVPSKDGTMTSRALEAAAGTASSVATSNVAEAARARNELARLAGETISLRSVACHQRYARPARDAPVYGL